MSYNYWTKAHGGMYLGKTILLRSVSSKKSYNIKFHAHAISRSQISVHKSLLWEIFHSVCNLNSELQQIFNYKFLQVHNKILLKFCIYFHDNSCHNFLTRPPPYDSINFIARIKKILSKSYICYHFCGGWRGVYDKWLMWHAPRLFLKYILFTYIHWYQKIKQFLEFLRLINIFKKRERQDQNHTHSISGL